MDDARPTVSIILVNYNTREMTLRCLRALYDDIRDLNVEVWVVDNASTDKSIAAIQEAFPAVKLIENSINRGFGAANNRAMRQASGQTFLLLNTDAFLQPGALPAMLAYFDAYPHVGVAGPKLVNADGSLQHSCFRFPTPARAVFENSWMSALLPNHPVIGDYRRWKHDTEREVDWIVGACMLIRREVFEKTGGFDEAFFMYAEEADWQKRIRDAGWPIGFTPAAVVTHLGGASGAAEKTRINRHFFESLDYYQRKHHGTCGLIAFRAAMVCGCGMRALLWMGAWALPRKRAVAVAKIRMHLWLVRRQATHWRLPISGRQNEDAASSMTRDSKP